MSRFGFILTIIFLAALNWAALHDIAKGEADLSLEWLTLTLSVIVLAAALLVRRWRRNHPLPPRA